MASGPELGATIHGVIRPWVFALASVSVLGCGDDKPRPAASGAGISPRASAVEHLFPLEEGKIYHYVTRDGPETGMLVAKVHRSDGAHGELRLSNATKRFELTPDGVRYVGGAYILKTPIEIGASWPGEHGGTTKIATTDLSVEIPAGRFTSCVRTVEEGGRPPGSRYETTYCPGVGMVLLVVTAGAGEARAELKAYGAPVKIE